MFSCEVWKIFKNIYFEPILKNICKRLLLYLAKEVEHNFIKQLFSCEQKKRLNTISETKPNIFGLK